jgi:hypothetical protein
MTYTALLVDATIMLVALGGSVSLVWHCLCAANHMTKKTNHWVRMSIVVISSAAFGEIALILAGKQPTVVEALLIIGILTSVSANRRVANCPCIVSAVRGCPAQTKTVQIHTARPI